MFVHGATVLSKHTHEDKKGLLMPHQTANANISGKMGQGS